MIRKTLLTPACFGPVQYFMHLWRGPVIIENHANYVRQTYRSRYIIAGANTPLTLSVPVEKGHSLKIPERDVKIAYHMPWQKNHWRSIVSAYNSSPFFEFYMDDIEPFFQKRYTYLLDLNLAVTEVLTDLLSIDSEISFTSEFNQNPGNGILDLRESLHPKKDYTRNDPFFKPVAYKQVFDDRHGFIPNLSILDLLFNKGPEARLILTQSCTTK